ncbi:hypothetical protein F4818DRAFT_235580 [Hypoxylon cercidicola]|nr:hypothetical protein F4818DRAFT_235580 [Hypoxylon cercidicola]
MKAGMRVVQITLPKAKKPTATVAEKGSKKRIAASPPVETRPRKRVVRSPDFETGPEPVSSATPHAHSATCSHCETHDLLEPPHTPSRNLDSNGQPFPWSPSMFSPDNARHNWTWSDWDSPSWEFEDVTYQSDDSPKDPLARLHPVLRAKIKAVLAMKPNWSPPATSTDSLEPDTFSFIQPNYMGSFSSHVSTRSKSPDSSWVNIDEAPWPTRLLQMRLDDSRYNPQLERIVMPEFSPLSSRSGSVSSLDTSTHSRRYSQRSERDTRDRSAKILSVPSASHSDASIHSRRSSRQSERNTQDCSAKIPSAPPASSLDASIHSRRSSQRSERNTRDLSAKIPSVPSASHSDASIPSPPSEPSSPLDVDVEEQPGSYLDVLREAEERLRQRQAQRAQTGIRDRLPNDTDSSLGSFHIRSVSSSSGGSTRSNSTGDILRHFRSFSRPSSPLIEEAIEEEEAPPTFIPESYTAPVRLASPPPPPPPTPASRHFHTLRQLPLASAVETRQTVEEPPRGEGFGWKSLACVAVAAAAVGAGLAYWFTG